MFYDEKFNSNARKLLDYNSRLDLLFHRNRLSDMKFREGKKQVYERLMALKRWNIELINGELDSLKEKRGWIEQNRGNASAGSQYDSSLMELEHRKGDLNTEKNLIELCDGDGYLTYLKDHLDRHDFNKTMRRGIYQNSAKSGTFEGRKVPPWATVTAFVMVAFAASLGVLAGSAMAVVLGATLTVVSLVVGTVILHFCATIAGLENATIEKAFTCLIASILAGVGVNVLLWILAIVIAILGSLAGIAGGMFLMTAVNFIAGFIVSAAVVKHFYKTTWSKSIVVLVLQTAINLIVGLILLAIVGLGFLSIIFH